MCRFRNKGKMNNGLAITSVFNPDKIIDCATWKDPHQYPKGIDSVIVNGQIVIREGEHLRVSFYHGTFIYNDQTPICMSEPKLYEIWGNQIRLVHQALEPRYYMLNMDELRTGGSCEACKSRRMTMGQILGDTLTMTSPYTT
jgi:hypothetical protein